MNHSETLSTSQIADALEEVGTLLEISGENAFRTRAYINAARILRGTQDDIQTFIEKAKARQIKGVGQGLTQDIDDLAFRGKLDLLEELKQDFPQGVLEILKLKGLGAKKVRIIYKDLGITSIEELETACKEGQLAEVKGFGEKTLKNILSSIDNYRTFKSRFLFSVALKEAEDIVLNLQKCSHCKEINIAGSLRRCKETVKDIDLIASSDKPSALMDYFIKLPQLTAITAHGETKSSAILTSGIALDLRVVKPSQYPSALLHFTGSKEHNTQLRSLALKHNWKLNEYGLFHKETAFSLADEKAIYNKLELAYIPPELREAQVEIEEASHLWQSGKKFPDLIQESDLKGVLHCHSTYSDGSSSLKQLAVAIRDMGFSYLGISDHSQTAAYAGGLKADDIKRQHEEIDLLNEELKPFMIFKGIESDILVDGSLDYEDKILETFDFVIASVHSNFNLDKTAMTRRIIRAINNPFTTILGHPTGRLLLKREGYQLNIQEILEAAKSNGVAIEINANPWRLDLDWRQLREAKRLGIQLPICPDAHSIKGVKDLRYGIGIARKGGLEKKHVLNCLNTDEFQEFLNKRHISSKK